MKMVFTIAAKNYLANAVALGRSVKKHSPESVFYIVLADEWDEQEQTERVPFSVIEAKSLGISDYCSMSFMYDVVEFSTSIKPFAFLHFFDRFEKVIYMDPDTYVMSSDYDHIWHMLDEHDIVLTPHIVDMNIEEYNDIEAHILQAGVFNLGFIGAKRSTETTSFMRWWAQRLKTECIRGSGLFVDQKWIDYLPVFCGNYLISLDKGWDIADWNLFERTITVKGDSYMVADGEKLSNVVFWHFSKYRNQSPGDYLKAFGITELKKTEEISLICRLIEEYRNELEACGFEYWSKQPYAYNAFSDGRKINLLQRRLYRSCVKEKESNFTDAPFSPESEFSNKLQKIRMHSGRGTSRFAVFVLNVSLRILGMERFEIMRKKILNTLDINNLVEIWKKD